MLESNIAIEKGRVVLQEIQNLPNIEISEAVSFLVFF